MYGLLLESIQHYVKEQHGEARWQQVLEEAGLHNMMFTTHRQYNDQLMLRLATACSTVLPHALPSVDRAMHYFGTCFVEFGRVYGYDKILRVAGRHYRDFLHGIDNLHETIRFSYPRMQSPSFMVEEEDERGCVLVYRSGRRGFAHYVMGQLQQCALQLYHVNVRITILEQGASPRGCHVRFRLHFHNAAYCPPLLPPAPLTTPSSRMDTVPGSLLFQLFPFCIVFNKHLLIQRVGTSAANLLGDRCQAGTPLTSVFILRRPVVEFTWNNIVCLQDVVFELEAVTEGDTQQVQHSTRPSPIVGGITSSTHPSVRDVTSPTEQHVGDVTSPVVPLFGNVTKQKKGPTVLVLHEHCLAGKVTQSPDYTIEESTTTANSCKDVPVKTCETFGHSESGVKEGTSSLITLLGANGKCREASKLPLDSDSCRRTTKTIQSDIGVAAARQHRDVNAVCTDGKVLKTASALARGPESSKSKQTCKKLLRGQMKFIPEWGQIAFLCTPLVSNLGELQQLNMYLNDLNMYDNSRDLVLHGHNHAPLLESLMEQQVAISSKIRENLKALDKERNEGNKLLYSMLPETIAVRLKQGENPINTCQTFDAVTILFSYLVGFKDICSNSDPMDVISVINNSFAVFDPIVDKYGLYKVETLGDAVYMVAGGVPDPTEQHAQRVAGLALDFISEAHRIKCHIENKTLTVRVGMHSGSVVAGIVGKRTPQYCLFGDTVNTAARLQSHSLPGRIHLSEPCHQCLKNTDLVSIYRGQVSLKGKGELKTYWLAGRRGDKSTECNTLLFHRERDQHLINQAAESVVGDLHALHTSSSGSFCLMASGTASQDDADLSKDTAIPDDVFTDKMDAIEDKPKEQ